MLSEVFNFIRSFTKLPCEFQLNYDLIVPACHRQIACIVFVNFFHFTLRVSEEKSKSKEVENVINFNDFKFTALTSFESRIHSN